MKSSFLSSAAQALGRNIAQLWQQAWAVLTIRRPRWWLFAAVLCLLVIIPLDDDAGQLLRFGPDSAAQKIAGVISKRGDFYNWCMALVVAFFAWGWLRRSKKWQLLALAMLMSCASAGLLSLSVRITSGRPRPALGVADGLYGPRFKPHKGGFLFFDYDYQSFPSGHTTTAFATAAPVAVVAPAIGVPLLGASAVVAWSRFQLNRHHPSDLYVGALFGGLFGTAFGLAVRRLQRKRPA